MGDLKTHIFHQEITNIIKIIWIPIASLIIPMFFSTKFEIFWWYYPLLVLPVICTVFFEALENSFNKKVNELNKYEQVVNSLSESYRDALKTADTMIFESMQSRRIDN